MSLQKLAMNVKHLEARTKADPLVYFRPTPPQRAFLADPAKIKMLRGGNQVGKTAAAVVLLLWHCLGRHRFLDVDPPPITAILVTHSHAQSRIIMKKLYEMIPPCELHPSVEYKEGRGFTGLAPFVRFMNGSIIRIKTVGSGSLGLASETANLCVIDEPVEMEIFNECLARTLRGGRGGSRGTLALTMTPVGCDVSYLRDMVTRGMVSDHVAPLSVDATTPESCRPILSNEQITEITAQYLPIDRNARIRGDWDVGILEGRVFENFTDEHISSMPVPAGGDYRFAIGIDHGSRPNSQVCILSCIDLREHDRPRVYVLDEYVSGMAPPEAHATAILEMLKRNSIDPAMCIWTGDTAHKGSREKSAKIMSNLLLIRAFESILQYPSKSLPWRIRTAVKHRYSVYHGASVIHSIISRKHFFIHPRCERTIISLKRWVLYDSQSRRSENEYGHAIDCLRYNILPVISSNYTAPLNIKIT